MKYPFRYVLIFLLNIFISNLLFANTTKSKYEVTDAYFDGMYIGVNFGSGWGILNNSLAITNNIINPYFSPDTTISGVSRSGSPSLNSNEFIGGGQIGGNMVIKNNILLGWELSYDYINLHKFSGGVFYYTTSHLPYFLSTSASARQMGTLRPRIGYVFKKLLPYFTVGGAVTKINFNQTFTESIFASTNNQLNKTIYGYSLGSGLECALFNQVSFKIEYLYNNFNNVKISNSFFGTNSARGFGATFNNSLSGLVVHNLTFGLNVHF